MDLPGDWKKNIETIDKPPKNFPPGFPPFVGFFGDGLRNYLKIPADECCADGYYHQSRSQTQWHLIEQKSKYNIIKGLKQLDQTAKYLENIGLSIDHAWLCYISFDIKAKQRFRAGTHSSEPRQKILLQKNGSKPFLLRDHIKIKLHQVPG